MAVTASSIRALLNRPRGLLDDTITEYISIRTLEVNKVSRSNIYGEGDHAVTTDLKEAAIKSLVALDCLETVLSFDYFSIPQILGLRLDFFLLIV